MSSIGGWLLLNKAPGISSFKALYPIKNTLKKLGQSRIKVGHAGTLDPFAHGLLLVGIGQATKLMDFALHYDKHYEFTVQWGEKRDTDDITGEVELKVDYYPNIDDINRVIPQFIGNIWQIPPPYSAIKIQGKSAYKLARAGEKVLLKSRKVTIYSLKVLHHSSPYTSFSLHCSKGFYVRSLARDMGVALNNLGFVSKLYRTKISKFSVADTKEIGYKAEHAINNIDDVLKNLLPLQAVLDDIPVLEVNADLAQSIRNGRAVKIESIPSLKLSMINLKKQMIAMKDQELVAILEFDDVFLRAKKVFQPQI